MLQHAITVFLGFFAIMNPIANTPVFVGLTEGEDKNTQKKIAIRALILSFFIVAIFAIMGKTIFNLFGITLTALKLTGGVLVFIIGYEMLHGEASKMHKHRYDSDIDIAVSPLAVPILSGPGTIATAMTIHLKVVGLKFLLLLQCLEFYVLLHIFALFLDKNLKI